MRKLWIINCENTVDIEGKQIPRLIAPGIFIPNSSNPIPFAKAKSILGQEYPFAIYNMRAENGVNFHFEAFAILAGTIQENGTLFLLCPQWDNLENELDFDALRWNENHAITCPNFYLHFKQLVAKFDFEVRADLPKLPTASGQIPSKIYQLTQEQQNICKIYRLILPIFI